MSQPRPPVTRDRCTAAAIVVADAVGLGAVTMRRVAADLGVEAMSLYHHVRNKDDLLDAMVDAVYGEIEEPPEDATDWIDAMRARSVSLREVLVRHPWAIALMEARRHPGPNTLRHHDAVIACCRRSGMTVEMTAHAFSLVDSYVYGFVMQETHLPISPGDDVDEALSAMLPADFARTYPYLAELATEHVSRPGYDYGDEFGFGLDAVLDVMADRAGLG